MADSAVRMKVSGVFILMVSVLKSHKCQPHIPSPPRTHTNTCLRTDKMRPPPPHSSKCVHSGAASLHFLIERLEQFIPTRSQIRGEFRLRLKKSQAPGGWGGGHIGRSTGCHTVVQGGPAHRGIRAPISSDHCCYCEPALLHQGGGGNFTPCRF